MPRIFAATAAATFASLIAAGAAAAQPDLAAQNSPRVAVRYADLNLSSMAGRSELSRRIAAAANALCGPAPALRDLGATQAYRDCVKTSIASAAPAVEQAALAQVRSQQQLAQGPGR